MGTRAGTCLVNIRQPGDREDRVLQEAHSGGGILHDRDVVLRSVVQRDKMVMAVARPFVETVAK